MIKRIRIRLMAAGMATMLPLALWTGHAAAQSKEIVLGAMLPLTGSAAQIGLEEQNGIQFATDKVNAAGGIRGYKIRIVYEDTQGKPDLGVLAFNRLVDLHQVSGIFTAYSSVTLATAPLATRKKVFVLNPAAQTSKLATASPYLVNTISLAKDEVSIIAKYAAEKLGKKAAVYYDSGSVGIDLRDEFKAAFLAAGGTIVADEAVEFGNTNLRPTLLKIAAAKPDFVFMAATTGPGVTGDQISQIPDYPTAIGTSFFAPIQELSGHRVPHAGQVQCDRGDGEGVQRQIQDAGHAILLARVRKRQPDHVQGDRLPAGEGAPRLPERRPAKALFEVKSFDTPNGKISFDTNTARREVEIHKLTPAGRAVVEKIAH